MQHSVFARARSPCLWVPRAHRRSSWVGEVARRDASLSRSALRTAGDVPLLIIGGDIVFLPRLTAHEPTARGFSYLGASGNRLYSKNNVNRFDNAGLLNPSCITTRYASDGIAPIGPDYSGCPNLNPHLDTLAIRGNLDHSSYHELQVSLDSRSLPGWGMQFGINYTWIKEHPSFRLLTSPAPLAPDMPSH